MLLRYLGRNRIYFDGDLVSMTFRGQGSGRRAASGPEARCRCHHPWEECPVLVIGLFFLFRDDHGGEPIALSSGSLASLSYLCGQKISVLQHDPSAHLPIRPGDPTPTSRNLDPLMHPFARARERTRALNAAKIERIFAKPFVASLEGHSDAVEVLVRKPKSLSTVASASWNGGVYVVCPCHALFFLSRRLDHSGITAEPATSSDIIIHDLQQRTEVLTLRGAHKGKASGLCFGGENGDRFLSCGVDKTVKLWNTPTGLEQDPEVCPFLLHVIASSI